MHLVSNFHPDIVFTVSQYERFRHCSRRSYEKALKKIVYYLDATGTRNIVLNPIGSMVMCLCAGVDFSGLWNIEEAGDPIALKSRTIFVLTLGEIPVL